MNLPFVIMDHGKHIKINAKFLNALMSLKNPHFICTIGKTRFGKSTTLNQIIQGPLKDKLSFLCNEPFETGFSPDPVTKGCNGWFSVKLHHILKSFNLSTDGCDDADIVFVDTEGFGSLDGSSMFLVPGILTIIQISTEIIYLTRSQPTSSDLEEIAHNEKLNNHLRALTKIEEPEKIVYVAQYNLIDESDVNDPINVKIKKLNNQRRLFQQKIEKDLHTKTIMGPFKNERNPNQDDPILHVYWDSLKDIVLSIKDSVNRRGQRDARSLTNSIKTLFHFFKEYGNNISVDKNFPAIVEQIFQKILDNQIYEAKERIEKQLNSDYSKCIRIQTNSNAANEMINNEISADMFQNVISLYYQNKVGPLVQEIKRKSSRKVRSKVKQFFYILGEDETIQTMSKEFVQLVKNAHFQEDLNSHYNERDYNKIVVKLMKFFHPRINGFELTYYYLQKYETETLTREINNFNFRISKVVQDEYLKLPKWNDVIRVIENQAYQTMSRDNQNKNRKSIQGYQKMFLDEAKAKYEINDSRESQIKNVISSVYKQTKPTVGDSHSSTFIVREPPKPTSPSVIEIVKKQPLIKGPAKGLFKIISTPICIMGGLINAICDGENFFNATKGMYDFIDDVVEEYIPDKIVRTTIHHSAN